MADITISATFEAMPAHAESAPAETAPTASRVPLLVQLTASCRLWVLHDDAAAPHPERYELEHLLAAARARGLDARHIHPRSVDVLADPCGSRVFLDGIEVAPPDVVLARTGAGTDRRALAAIQGLELCGSIAINGALGILECQDKLRTARLLASAAVAHPRTMLVPLFDAAQRVGDLIGFPAVIKVPAGTQGEGVTLARDACALRALIGMLSAAGAASHLIAQRFVEHSHGRDLRVLVIDGEAVAAMERVSALDFRANASLGAVTLPFALGHHPEVADIAVRAARAVGIDVAGVDLLFESDDTYTVCEVNSAPGFQGLERAHPELDVAGLLVDHALTALQRPRAAALPAL